MLVDRGKSFLLFKMKSENPHQMTGGVKHMDSKKQVTGDTALWAKQTGDSSPLAQWTGDSLMDSDARWYQPYGLK